VPSDTFHHRATAATDPETVWNALQHAATWQGFGLMEEVAAEVVEAGRLHSFDWTANAGGRRHPGKARVTAAEPGRSITLALDASEIAGEIVVALMPAADGTEVAVSLTARSRGLLAGMFWGIVADALRRGLPEQVERFAATF
jgi:carbon monoxide dehydrogenase subunit G